MQNVGQVLHVFFSCRELAKLEGFNMARASASASLDGAAKAAKGKKKIVVKKDGTGDKKKIARQHRVRSWDEAASRCIALKLGSFPRSQVMNNVDSKGEKIHSLVAAELQRVKPEGKYITLEFWQGIMKSHKLTGGFASCLPSVDRDERVCKELNSCLMLVHSPNPEGNLHPNSYGGLSTANARTRLRSLDYSLAPWSHLL